MYTWHVSTAPSRAATAPPFAAAHQGVAPLGSQAGSAPHLHPLSASHRLNVVSA